MNARDFLDEQRPHFPKMDREASRTRTKNKLHFVHIIEDQTKEEAKKKSGINAIPWHKSESCSNP